MDQSQNFVTQPPQSKSTKKKVILLSILAIIIACGLVAGTYAWQQAKVKDTQAKLDEAKSKIEELSKEKKQAAAQETAKDKTNSSQKYLEIPQYGIKLPLSNEILDLSYTIETENGLKFIHFSTKTTLALECPTDPLGVYTVRSTPTNSLQAATLATQVNGNYIYYTHTQFACGDTDSDRTKVAALIDPLLQAVKSAQAIE